jgi:hypothetical protein
MAYSTGNPSVYALEQSRACLIAHEQSFRFMRVRMVKQMLGLKRDRTPSLVWGVPRWDTVTADNEVALCSTWS